MATPRRHQRQLRHLARAIATPPPPPPAAAAHGAAAASATSAQQEQQQQHKKEWSIAIHGGAGVMVEPGSAQEQEYHATLERSLRAGAAILEAGGASEEAVEAAVEVMEDSPLFNCAHGSSVTMGGQVEMDAAMMSGRSGAPTRAGAVSSATRVRNPIKAARKVLGDDRFVLLTADGADDFAEDAGLVTEGPDYFIAEWRWDLHTEHMPAELAAQKQRQQQQRQSRLQARQPVAVVATESAGVTRAPRPELRFGTVGCVALDRSGNLCAGTSKDSPKRPVLRQFLLKTLVTCQDKLGTNVTKSRSIKRGVSHRHIYRRLEQQGVPPCRGQSDHRRRHFR
jgi:isoaspartyl peptidase/L-asparaginase-like protein (Ntn-hydrolase superfamily)